MTPCSPTLGAVWLLPVDETGSCLVSASDWLTFFSVFERVWSECDQMCDQSAHCRRQTVSINGRFDEFFLAVIALMPILQA